MWHLKPGEAAFLKWLLCGMGVMALVLRELVLRRLRRRHESTWNGLGQPQTGRTFSLRSEGEFNRYLASGRVKEAGDRTLTRLGSFYTWVRRAVIGGLILLWIIGAGRGDAHPANGLVEGPPDDEVQASSSTEPLASRLPTGWPSTFMAALAISAEVGESSGVGRDTDVYGSGKWK